MSNKLVKIPKIVQLVKQGEQSTGCPLCAANAPPHAYLNFQDHNPNGGDGPYDVLAIYHPTFMAESPSHLALAMLMRELDRIGQRIPHPDDQLLPNGEADKLVADVPKGTVFS